MSLIYTRSNLAALVYTLLLAGFSSAEDFSWRSVGTFDASTEPQSAVNSFEGVTVDGVYLVDVEFAHTISVLDGGVLQLNDGAFTIKADNGDTLQGSYTDFRYSPNPPPATDFAGLGEFSFTGGTGVFSEASGGGSWVAEASFFEGSTTMGIANHEWSGELMLIPEPSGLCLLGFASVMLLLFRQVSQP